MDVENLRIPHHTEKEICGATSFTEQGREFICILEPHPERYSKRRGGGIFQHYMVNRWPYRDEFVSDGTTI